MEFLSPGKVKAIILSGHPLAGEYGYTIYAKE
jgi:hypothetical protein